MDYLSTVRVLDTDYKLRDDEAARINHTHKVAEIEDLPSAIPTSEKLVPSGGLIGQVLAKTSASDYDVSWQYQQTGGLTCENIFTGQYSQTHNKAINCSKPVTDFDFIDVQFSSESGIKGVTRVYGPTVGTLFETDLTCNFASNSGFYMLSKVFNITGNYTINTWNYNNSGVYVTGRARLWGGNQSVEVGDFIGITAVWGWKGDQ